MELNCCGEGSDLAKPGNVLAEAWGQRSPAPGWEVVQGFSSHRGRLTDQRRVAVRGVHELEPMSTLASRLGLRCGLGNEGALIHC